MKHLVTAVDKYTDLILSAERFLWAHPETGYREVESSKYMESQFEALGYDLVRPSDITGFVTTIDTGREGPMLLILGELDSIICPSHKDANPETGAVHSCGHNAQCAALLGIAAALKEPGALDGLSGKIRLCAVPAEELLEIEYRSELKKAGKIRYFGGKSEFLSRGLFDGVDLAFMIHTSTGFRTTLGSVGCIAKNIIYKGVAAHAGGSPWNGRNALYAANCGLNAVNAIRETFREPDRIRVHPIITAGGDMVNAIPETVRLESYIRGSSFDAIASANERVDRALVGGALSLGTNIEIIDIPGYAPLHNSAEMIKVASEAIAEALPEVDYQATDFFSTGSTDMGDLSCIMPVIHPYCGGACGTGHGNNYEIADPTAACVDSAKWQLGMLYILLKDNASRAREIVASYEPLFASGAEYLAFMDSLNTSGDRIVYGETSAEVKVIG